MFRSVYQIGRGEEIKIRRNSDWSVIGLNDIMNFAKLKGAELDEWVSEWKNYSYEEKVKVYDEKVCHELNTFIKFNDQLFF